MGILACRWHKKVSRDIILSELCSKNCFIITSLHFFLGDYFIQGIPIYPLHSSVIFFPDMRHADVVAFVQILKM